MTGRWRGWRRAGGGTAAAAAMLVALGCREAATGPVDCSGVDPVPGEAKEILFIGNSLTYFNYLPDVVRALADSAGQLAPRVDQVANPDFSLDDHYLRGDAARAIRGACWDVVVLQQGPSSLAASRVQLLGATRLFAPIIRGRGATPALFSVWPAADRRADFPRAIESYRLAAEAVEGIMLPAASAWLHAWEADPDLELYSDGLHPSREGTFLAALVIVARLYGVDPATLPSGVSIRPDGVGRVDVRIAPATAAVLRQAAAEALLD
jgi:hypothetical protein